MLEGIAHWMDINKESIFDTRPWKVFGEGPIAETSNPINAQGFNEGRMKFTAKDIRFTKKDNLIYTTVMGVPEENILIKNLGSSNTQTKIMHIELLGSKEKIKWKQNDGNLTIEKPDIVPNEIANVFKIYLE